MKYIYTNITNKPQSVLLATKSQDSVGTRTFNPGAVLELDYPGLNMYVPNILSCIIIDNISPLEEPIIVKLEKKEKITPEPIQEPITKEVVISELPTKLAEKEEVIISDDTTTLVKEILQSTIVEPKAKQKPNVVVKKTLAKKIKK